jgi:hypothetical protein
MSGSFADRLPCRRATLAIALALLAILFAVEAKTAWYGPFGAGGDVQAAKALPADTAKIFTHRASAPNPLDSHSFLFTIFALVAFFAVSLHDMSYRPVLRSRPSLLNPAFTSPLVLYRPPPAL